MIIEEVSRNVHNIRIPYNAAKSKFRFLLSADQHWDNPDSQRDMFEKHLKQCKESGSLAFIFGDFFCAMQGKYDKRGDKSKVRPEHNSNKYLDLLVSTAAEWLMPYREQIAVIGLGNHETSILKNHETHLIERLVERLNIPDSPHKVQMGGYGGYIRLLFEHSSGGHRKSLVIKYFHGHGGGGPVTKGVIQSQRQAVFMPDADIVVSGHVHEEYIISYVRERLDNNGKITLQTQWHVRTPTYKDEYKDGYGGWHIETGKPPKPIGAWWLDLIVPPERPIEFDFAKAR